MNPLVTLYKNGKAVTVHAVDVEGWLKDNWSFEITKITPTFTEEPPKKKRAKPDEDVQTP